MRTTTDLARSVYGWELEAAALYDAEQVTFVTTQNLEDFPKNSLGAAISLVIDQVKAKHAEVSGLATSHDAMFAVALPGAEGLAIRTEGGRNALITWWDKDDASYVGVIPWVEAAPADLLASVEARIAAGVHSVDEVSYLARDVGSYGSLPFPDLRSIYDRHPVSLADIAVAAGNGEMDSLCYSKGLGYREGHMSHGRIHARMRRGAVKDVDLLQGIVGMFDLEPASTGDQIIDFEISSELTLAAREGRLPELHASLYALMMDRLFETCAGDIDNLVAKSAELGLSREVCLAYGDTDRHVSTLQLDGRVVWIHNNIDLNEQNVFVSVVHGEPGAWTSIDTYLASAWYRVENDEEDIWDYGDDGKRVDAPMDLEGFYATVRNAVTDGYQMGEDALLDALAAGDRPEHCRVLSYDVASKEIQLFPAENNTNFGTYLGLMLEMDLEAVTKVLAGEHEDDAIAGVEIQRHSAGATSLDDEARIDIETYLGQDKPGIR